MKKVHYCVLVTLVAAAWNIVPSDASWGGFIKKANQGLDLINKFTAAFSTQSDEELVAKQLDRGFQRWQQEAKVSVKQNIPPAIVGKALRKPWENGTYQLTMQEQLKVKSSSLTVFLRARGRKPALLSPLGAGNTRGEKRNETADQRILHGCHEESLQRIQKANEKKNVF